MVEAKEFVLSIYTAKIECPHCGASNSDWLCDPRGAVACCDSCEEEFLVPEGIKIVID